MSYNKENLYQVSSPAQIMKKDETHLLNCILSQLDNMLQYTVPTHGTRTVYICDPLSLSDSDVSYEARTYVYEVRMEKVLLRPTTLTPNMQAYIQTGIRHAYLDAGWDGVTCYVQGEDDYTEHQWDIILTLTKNL